MREKHPLEKTQLDGDIGHNWSSLKVLFQAANVKSRVLFGTLFFLFVAATTVLVLGIGFRQLIDQGLLNQNMRALNSALVLLGLAVFFMGVASYGRLYLVTWLGEHFIHRIKGRLFEKILHAPIAYFESTKTGDLLSRLNTDTMLLQILLSTSLPIMIRNIMIMMGGIFMMLYTSVALTGMVFLIVPCALLPIIIMGRWVKASSTQAQNSIGDVGSIAEECVYAIKTVKSFCKEAWALRRFDVALESAADHTLRQMKRRGQLVFLVILIVSGGIGMVLWLGAQAVISGTMTGGALSSFIFYAVIVAATVSSFSDIYGDIQRAMGAADRVQKILMLSPEGVDFLNVENFPKEVTILFDQVAFAYPARPDFHTLKDISFKIQPGERVAIVGRSGVGKTTIFQLLLGFYKPVGGKILFGDTPIECMSLDSIRQHIAFVPQDSVMFSGTIRENILYGNLAATPDMVMHVAKIAAVDCFVKDLPLGYETIVGEKGMRLSGGQKQRISIARALLKPSPILLLDEATSSLDAANETHIYKALKKERSGQTTIVISHRLATMQQVDRILLLDQGRIVASGTHAQLLMENDLYKSLAALQFWT